MEHKQLVWAKMKRFSPWPGVVVHKGAPGYMMKGNQPKNSECIFFFGTKNFAWVDRNNIKPYVSNRHCVQTLPNKTAGLKDAVDRCEEYISDPILFKSNAEADSRPATAERDTDAAFNKLRQEGATGTDAESVPQSPIVAPNSNVSSQSTPIKTASPAQYARKTASNKKDSTNTAKVGTKRNANNGHSSHSKRPRMSSSEEPNVNTNADTSSGAVADPVSVPGASTSPNQNPPRNVPISTLRGRDRLDMLVGHRILDLEPPSLINLSNMSPSVASRKIVASKLRFGFLGLGTMGSGMVKSLLHSGHAVFVWNRTFEVCEKFVAVGAKSVLTPADLIDTVDITFSCVANPIAAKEMVFGNCGVLSAQSLAENKGYIEMTGMDDATSMDICHAITGKGGRYLETQIQGSKSQSENGELVLMSAGDKSLYDDCDTCFKAMSIHSVYLGEVGNACKMYMVLQVIAGVSLAALGEAMAFAQKAGLNQNDMLELLAKTPVASPMLIMKSQCMLNSDYSVRQQLAHMQKDLKYALSMSDQVEQPLPLAAAANEVFKHAKRSGYAEHDSSAVYAKSIL